MNCNNNNKKNLQGKTLKKTLLFPINTTRCLLKPRAQCFTAQNSLIL